MSDIKEVVPQLQPNRFKLAEYERTVHVATVEAYEGDVRKLLSNPNFWANAAQKLKPYDKIEVRDDTGSFYAEFLVLQVGRGWAKVFELSYVELETKVDNKIDDPYEIVWKGPHLKFCVIRKQDGERIHDSFKDKGDAIRWLSDFLKAA
jgi:hypothetical protein